MPVASFFADTALTPTTATPFNLLGVTGARALLEAFGRLSPRQRRLLVDVAEAMPVRD